jgi:diaminopimelate epimerase
MPAKIHFYKYQGAGNDFIMIDDWDRDFDEKDHQLINSICDRRFGIGGDGLILMQNHSEFDFEMKYFNADGFEGSMCGNGGRCIVAFAHFLGKIGTETRFLAVDGPHEAKVLDGEVELKMGDVTEVEKGSSFYFLDTGSPHYVRFVEKLESFDVFREGRKVRYSDRFRAQGTNVNFVQKQTEGIRVATYERGVEDETLSCGTGIVASSIAYYKYLGATGNFELPVQAKGGNLKVKFKTLNSGFHDIWLIGPAVQVFEGYFPL